MIKTVIFFKRRPGMAVEAFREHWRAQHAALIVRLPGLRRYVQNYPLGDDPVFDAVAESSFDDTQAMKALARTPEYAEVLADEPRFIDRASMGSIITEERVMKEGQAPASGIKRITFVRREPETPVEEFFRWFFREGDRRARDAAVLRSVHCVCRRAIYDSGRTPPWDGVEMCWYESLEAASAAPALRGSASLLASERPVSTP